MQVQQRRKVWIDAANVIHQDPETVSPDGRILTSAFECYEKLGYEVGAIMTYRSFHYYKLRKIPGFKALKDLKAAKKLRVVNFDDDKHLLDLCVKERAWLVTYDKFDTKKSDDGSEIERQRALYPDLPWEEIDEYTRGTKRREDGRILSNQHWSVRENVFYDPEMPKAPRSLFSTKLSKLIESIDELDLLLVKMDGIAEQYNEEDLPNRVDIRKRIKILQGRAKGLRDVMPDAELDEDSLSGYTVVELKSIAKGMGISGRSNKKKEQLIQMIKLHTNPTPEKRREDAKRERAKRIQQEGIQRMKMREKRRPKPKDKYPKTARAAKKTKEATKDLPTRDEERLKQVRKEQQEARRMAGRMLRSPPSPDGQERQIPEGEMKTAKCGEEVKKILGNIPIPERPTERSTLLDYIKAQRNSSWSSNAQDADILNWLTQRGLISINDNDGKSVEYLF